MASQIPAYLKYFFYLGWNWNFRLALAILYYELKGEKKYGIQTIGIYDLSTSVSGKDRKHASIYQPVNYYIGEWLFSTLSNDDIKGNAFLDAGCGRGRVMAMAAWHGFKKVYGFDISPRLCNEAIQNMDILQPSYPDTEFEAQCIDARHITIEANISVIFLFNPFDKKIMKDFIERVLESLDKNPRNLKILYANPECRDLWEGAGFKATHQKDKLYWLQGLVLEYKPDKN